MEPLVQWLLGGFILSLLFIIIARWFWKRFDKPSEAALEWQKEQEEKKKEREVWESVEMQMRREAEEAERKAAFQVRREVAASSGTSPDARTVAKAFESLGTTSLPTPQDGTEPESDEPQEPDWELVDRLKRIAGSDDAKEIPHPELPHAPNLPDISSVDSEE
tara:strand:- start:632 stop:1120 length:489 start_codon:yes stop_codon:yes gene_type:complete